jgi:hypothetical protein
LPCPAGDKNAGHVKQDKDLDALRDRADFPKLVTVLEGARDRTRNRRGGMEMNVPARPEVLRGTDHVQERRGDPGVDTVLQELCPNEQASPRDLLGPYVPDEGAFETSVGGAGI